ncbi:MAG: beta-L-arabinofuranosidase domain-containing protein, partial [Acidimicrobiia bacterium]
RDAASRLFDQLVRHHSYPTGAVGGRWLDESVGKRDEMPESMAYAESCAAVASARFCQAVWELTGDTRALDQLEVLVFNAVPCGVGADGESWFYSQPHAVTEVAAESNPWVLPFEYGQNMLLSWYPARRHRWFPVACCPTNLARFFATLHHHVAGVDRRGDLLVHLPISARITGEGWDVEITGDFPEGGSVDVQVRAAPAGKQVRLRVPRRAGGTEHAEIPGDGKVDLGVADEWWETDHRVEGAPGTVFLRRGPMVHCVEGVDLEGVDLRDLVVDTANAPADAFHVIPTTVDAMLHRRASPSSRPSVPLGGVPTVPYHAWANRGLTTMRYRFPRR